MAGAYLPPVVQQLLLNIDDYLAKIEEAKAAQDDLAAHTAESNAASRGEGELGGGGRGSMAPGGLGRAGRDAENLDKHLGVMRQILHGQLQTGLQEMSSNLKNIAAGLQAATNGISGFFSGIGNAFSSVGNIWSQPLSWLGSLVSFGKTWAVMVPTLMAAPALLAAIGGAAGGLAGSFTVLSTAVGLFALGAMKDLSYVTSVSNMAQFDALSAPLQRLYYAYHNLSNEFTIMTQTMGGSSTIIDTLTNMFNTMGVVVGRLGPLMGEVGSAGQAAFNILSGSLLGPQFQKFLTWVGAEATPVLTTFSQTFVNLASGWAGLMEDLTPAITLFDQGMVHLTATFANWANSPKGLAQVHAFIGYVKQAWPDVQKFWGGLGHIFYEFFSAGAKGAPGMAAALGGLFTTIGNAMPTLVNFADSVLPSIVHGFGQFTQGFFQGLGQSLGGIGTALNGVNWKGVGDTVGKIAGDLVQLLPRVITVVGWLINLADVVANLPGGIMAIVGAWMLFQTAVATGSLITNLSTILGLAGKIAGKFGVGTAASGMGGAAGAGGAEAPAAAGAFGATFATVFAPLAAAVIGPLVAKAVFDALQPKVGSTLASKTTPGPVKGFLAPLEAIANNLLGGGQVPKTNPMAALLARDNRMLGGNMSSSLYHSTFPGSPAIGSKKWAADIRIESQNIVNVAGPMSPEAAAQLDALFRQHDQQLVSRLQQMRPAWG